MTLTTMTEDVHDHPARAAAPVIVAGVDGSPSSWDAVDWAAREVARVGGLLVVMHVTSAADPAAGFGLPLDYADVARARTAIDGELQAEAERRAARRGVPIRFVSQNGNAATALIGIARDLHADLVVVGRSVKPLHRLAGSISHRLTSRDDAPVVVVVP